MKSFSLALLALLVFSACGSPQPSVHTSATDMPKLNKNQMWQLSLLNGRNLPNDAKITTLSFNPEAGSFRGQTACNSYAGAYLLGETSAADGRRSFSILLLTPGSIRCPEADMNTEERFLSVLKKANYILITEYSLSLYHDNKEILHFELQ